MLGIDDRLAGLSTGGSLALALLVAVLLGLRHATDPDHLTAVSTLVLGDGRDGARRARRLGLAWGAGHATTLVALGLPAILFRRFLPDGAERAAEAAIGAAIIVLAVRLLLRWRRGCLHSHPHAHGDAEHRHPHVHETRHEGDAHRHGHDHDHARAAALGRSQGTAYGIGLVHGAGGSAGVGLLLIGAMPDHVVAAVALVLFAAATAVSMALVSAVWGGALARPAVSARLARLAPLLATASLAFGLFYAVAAVG